jgi:hypothetical protein
VSYTAVVYSPNMSATAHVSRIADPRKAWGVICSLLEACESVSGPSNAQFTVQGHEVGRRRHRRAVRGCHRGTVWKATDRDGGRAPPTHFRHVTLNKRGTPVLRRIVPPLSPAFLGRSTA